MVIACPDRSWSTIFIVTQHAAVSDHICDLPVHFRHNQNDDMVTRSSVRPIGRRQRRASNAVVASDGEQQPDSGWDQQDDDPSAFTKLRYDENRKDNP